MGRYTREQDRAWRKQIFEVLWKQARGRTGAAMCETRDLGIQWGQWYTLLFEEQVAVDMRVVCPQELKTMLLKQARNLKPPLPADGMLLGHLQVGDSPKTTSVRKHS